MANLAMVSAGKFRVVESIIQDTQIAAEAVVAGQAVRYDTSTGKFTGSNGSSAGEARIYGLAKSSVAAGFPVTAIRKGVVDGWEVSGLAYDQAVYLSDTDGLLADAAGTVSVVVGRVIPANSQTLGTAADKILFIDL